MNNRSRIAVRLFAALMSLAVVYGQAQETNRSTKVPKLTGLSVADAKAAAAKAGYVARFELGESARSPEQALKVYAQSPADGAALARGEVVKLTIYSQVKGTAQPPEGGANPQSSSSQPDGKVKVPSLVGQSSKEVATALRGLGLVPKFQLGSDPPSDEQQLTAYEQEPKSGVAVARGSEVRITIHAGRKGVPLVATNSVVGPRAVKRPSELTQVTATPFLDLCEEQMEPRSGELLLSATDLVVPAGPIQLEVRRAFQSLPRKPGLLGTRWQLNWESRLVKKGTKATIEQSSQLISFSLDARTKQYRSIAGDSLAIGKDAAVWTKPDGSRDIFDPQGRLVEQDRRNGNTVTLRYDTLGRLARVEGPFQTFLNFVTDTEGRLTRIESSTGAVVHYGYDPPTTDKPQPGDEFTVRYAYDSVGLLARIDRPRFGPTQYTYDKKLRVTGHRWADGTSDRIEHDDAAHTRRHTDAAGAVSTLQRSADGRKVELTNPLGHKIVTENDAVGRPIVITGPTGMKAQFEYDALGRTVRVDNPAIGVTEFEYAGALKSPVKLIAPDGNEQFFEYDEHFNLVRQTNSKHKYLDTTFQYDAQGHIQSIETGDGQRSTFTYDAAGRRDSITDADGQKWRFEYGDRGNLLRTHDPLGGVTERAYDTQDRLTSFTDAAGGTTTYEYGQQGRLFQINITDPRGGVTRKAYNQRGKLVTITTPGNRTTRFNYDASGNLTSRTDPTGRTYQFERDAVGNLLREINPAGGITTRTYNPQGNVTSIIGPTGASTRFEYSPTGFVSRQIDSTGLPTEYHYDAHGRLQAMVDDAQRATQFDYIANRVTKVVPPIGRPVELKYDDRGFLASTQRGEKNVVTNEYDVLGRRTKERHSSGLEISYRYDARGNLVAREDNQGGRETIEYDRAGRAIAIQDANGATIRLKYDAAGNLLESTDPLRQVKRRVYNAAGELSEIVEPNGDKAKYEYDAVGRITTAHHPSGGKSSYAYDPLGKPTRIRNPLGKETRSTYDVAGRLISTTDANGQTTTFNYDVAGRMTEKQLADGNVVRYQYDVRGMLAEVDDGAFPVRYEHNLDGRVTRIEYPAIKRSLSYEYNDAGLKTRFVDSEGRTIHYEYDDLDRLSAMRVGDAEAIRFAYDAKDRLTSRVYPNGIRGAWQYDGDDQLLKLTYADAAGKTLAGWTYQYDAAGNRVQTTDANGLIVRHRYDPAGQLIEETSAGGQAVKYSYLAGGNRGTREQNGKAVSYRYDEADQLLAAGDETFTHDANGNVVERKGPKGTTRYAWDSEYRLVKVVLPDGKEVSYGYAPTGERIWRRDDKGIIHYVTDGQNLLAELDGDLKLKATYLHGNAIDQPLLMTRSDMTSFFHADALGSIRRLTDSKGEIRASYDHDAFGQVKVEADETNHAFRFTAREFDAATGLYYYRARYYDPRTGRFLSTDPVAPSLRQARTLNPYQYALNNPFRFTDPYGTWEIPRVVPYAFPNPDTRGQFVPSLDAGPHTVRVNEAIYNARSSGPTQRADFVAVVDHEFSHFDDFKTVVDPNATRLDQGRAWGQWLARPVNRATSEVKAYTKELNRLEKLGGDPELIQSVRDTRTNWNARRLQALQNPGGQGAQPPGEAFSQLEELGAAAAAPRPVGPELLDTPIVPPPQSSLRTAGKVVGGGMLVAGVASSIINVVTSDNPAEQLVEEAAGWSGGAIASVIGGGLLGPPGAVIGGLLGDVMIRAAMNDDGTRTPPPYLPPEAVTDASASQPASRTTEGTPDLSYTPLPPIQIPAPPSDIPELELPPPSVDLANLFPTLQPSGDLTDEDRARARDASIQGRAREADRTLTDRERQAAQQAAGSGQGLPGGGGYSEPNYEEIGRAIGNLINSFGSGGGGGSMGNHPRKK